MSSTERSRRHRQRLAGIEPEPAPGRAPTLAERLGLRTFEELIGLGPVGEDADTTEGAA